MLFSRLLMQLGGGSISLSLFSCLCLSSIIFDWSWSWECLVAALGSSLAQTCIIWGNLLNVFVHQVPILRTDNESFVLAVCGVS